MIKTTVWVLTDRGYEGDPDVIRVYATLDAAKQAADKGDRPQRWTDEIEDGLGHSYRAGYWIQEHRILGTDP